MVRVSVAVRASPSFFGAEMLTACASPSPGTWSGVTVTQSALHVISTS